MIFKLIKKFNVSKIKEGNIYDLEVYMKNFFKDNYIKMLFYFIL